MKKLLILLCMTLMNFPITAMLNTLYAIKTTYLTIAAAKKYAQITTDMVLPVITHKKLYTVTCAHIALNYMAPNSLQLSGVIGNPLSRYNKKLLALTMPLFIFTTWYKVTHEQTSLHKETQAIVNNNTNTQVKKVTDKLNMLEESLSANTLVLEQIRDDAITKDEFQQLFTTTEDIKDTVKNMDKNKLDTGHFDTKIDTVLKLITTTKNNTNIAKNNTFDILKIITIMQKLLEQTKEKNELLKKAFLRK